MTKNRCARCLKPRRRRESPESFPRGEDSLNCVLPSLVPQFDPTQRHYLADARCMPPFSRSRNPGNLDQACPNPSGVLVGHLSQDKYDIPRRVAGRPRPRNHRNRPPDSTFLNWWTHVVIVVPRRPECIGPNGAVQDRSLARVRKTSSGPPTGNTSGCESSATAPRPALRWCCWALA